MWISRMRGRWRGKYRKGLNDIADLLFFGILYLVELFAKPAFDMKRTRRLLCVFGQITNASNPLLALFR